MLITIEGIDGSGKSSLLEGLKSELSDLNVVYTREPGSTWIGEQVRRGIAENIDPVAEALLFCADHAAHLGEVIKPSLKENRIIISDRYTDSRFAYQAVTLKKILPEPMQWLKDVHEGWTIKPDRTFLLVLPVEEALARLKKDREKPEHFECGNVLREVLNNYLEIVEKDPERFILIDALKEREEIIKFVADCIRQMPNKQNSMRR